MWVHVCHLSEKTLSKREAWVAALRSFIPRYALSVGEAVVVMIDPWKICYNTIEKLFLQQAADTRDSRKSFRNSRRVLLTREMSKRSHSARSCGFHDTRLRLPSPTSRLRSSTWQGRNTAKTGQKQKHFPPDGFRWKVQRRLSPNLVYKQNQKCNTLSERLEILFQPHYPSSHNKDLGPHQLHH